MPTIIDRRQIALLGGRYQTDVSANTGSRVENARLNFNNSATVNVSVQGSVVAGSPVANVSFSVNTAAVGSGGGGSGATVAANGTVRVSNGSLNFNNTATINVAVTANGSQANIAFSLNNASIVGSGNAIADIEAAPYIRGTVSAARWPGVTLGAVDGPTRVNNAIALQEAIQYAVDNRYIFTLDAGNYEIDSANGISIPAGATGFTWKSALTSTITQYADNAPILTISGVGSSGGATFGIDFEGCTVHYAREQTANTNANAVRFGNMWLCRLKGFRISNTLTSARSYRGVFVPGGEFFFSNHVEDIKVFQARESLLEIANIGTGNLWENIYLSGTSPGGQQQSVNTPFKFQTGSQQQLHESVFNQLNIEWTIALNLMTFSNIRGAVFNSVHLEQNRLSGAHASFISAVISNLQFNGLMALDNRFETSIASGFTNCVKPNSETMININNMCVIINQASYVDRPLYVVWQGSDRNNNPAHVNINNLRLIDGSGSSLRANAVLDHTIDFENFGQVMTNSVGKFESGEPQSTAERGQFYANTTRTIYGAYGKNGFFKVPSGLSGDIDITLSKYMGPANTRGNNVLVSTGYELAIRRQDGTVTGNLNIYNWDGTLITTNTTSANTMRFHFNGTNMVMTTF